MTTVDPMWIALGTFILSLIGAIVVTTLGVKRFSESVEVRLDVKIETLKRDHNTLELAYERKLGQQEVGLRHAITEVGFYVRDNFVQNEVFNRMIDLAAANNENQLRTLSEQLNRLNDKLDAIQAGQRRTP